MKFSAFLRRGGFLPAVLALLIAGDLLFQSSGWVQSSGYFYLNDYEVARRDHPEAVWDRVIFGSSELISGYREDLTSAHYVNLGMDYGVITDLETLLKSGEVQVGSDLVLALNWCVLCDTLDTNPTYIWHKGWYEPYVYFERDRLGPFLSAEWDALIGAGDAPQPIYLGQGKIFYHGQMTQEELEARMDKLAGLYWDQGVSGYEKNLAALSRVFAWCGAHGVRVRALWLPENQAVAPNATDTAVRELARQACEAAGVEFRDMTAALPNDCFYDTGHLSYEYGAGIFTEVLDQWLLS